MAARPASGARSESASRNDASNSRSFYPARAISWSVYTCIPCLLLGAALFVIDRNPACKQELKKRFFF